MKDITVEDATITFDVMRPLDPLSVARVIAVPVTPPLEGTGLISMTMNCSAFVAELKDGTEVRISRAEFIDLLVWHYSRVDDHHPPPETMRAIFEEQYAEGPMP